MEKREKLEIDIDVKDLIWEFLRGWRVIVCCALIGSILMGAMSFAASYKKVNTPVVPNEVVTVNPTAQEVIDALTIDELPDVVAAVELKAQIDDKTEYLNSSTLMKVDPFLENRISLEYFVRGEDLATAKSSFANLVTNGMFGEELYTNELISFASDAESGMVVVEIIHVDAESCKALAEKVKTVWKDHTKTLKELGVVTDVTLTNEVQNVVVDEELHAFQDAYLKECMADQDTLAKMRADMNGNQVSAYFHMWNMMYGEPAETEDAAETNSAPEVVDSVPQAQKAKATVDLKQVVIGAILGAVLAIVYLFVAYLLTGKLRTANEVEKLYSVKLLGTLEDTEQKKKAFVGVDKMIYRLRHLGTKNVSKEEQVKLAAASVAILCQKKEVNTVYVSSSKLDAISTKVLEALRAELERKGITLQLGADILSDADALLAAAKIGNIVLVEKESKSAYKGILKCVQVCDNNHIDVLGMVVIEK